MNHLKSPRRLAGALALTALLGAACAGNGTTQTSASGECETPETPTITFAAYSTPREVYGKIISAFQAQ